MYLEAGVCNITPQHKQHTVGAGEEQAHPYTGSLKVVAQRCQEES